MADPVLIIGAAGLDCFDLPWLQDHTCLSLGAEQSRQFLKQQAVITHACVCMVAAAQQSTGACGSCCAPEPGIVLGYSTSASCLIIAGSAIADLPVREAVIPMGSRCSHARLLLLATPSHSSHRSWHKAQHLQEHDCAELRIHSALQALDIRMHSHVMPQFPSHLSA